MKPNKAGISTLGVIINELFDIPYKKTCWPTFGVNIVHIILRTIADGLRRGEVVEINGFGTFRIKHYKPRKFPPFIVAGRRKNTIRSTVSEVRTRKPRIIFTPSVQLMAMLNYEGETTYKEREAMKNWHKP